MGEEVLGVWAGTVLNSLIKCRLTGLGKHGTCAFEVHGHDLKCNLSV